MADYEVKTGDIARITGVPEKTVRKILREHEDRFTCREIGRVRIYTAGAIETVMDLAGAGGEETATGAQSNAGRKDAGGGEEGAHAAHAPQPDRHLLGEMSAAIKTMQETIATQHLQIERLKRALEEHQARTGDINRNLQHLHDKTETLERIFMEQEEMSRLTREWIKYFDEWADEQSLPLLAKLRRALDAGKH